MKAETIAIRRRALLAVTLGLVAAAAVLTAACSGGSGTERDAEITAGEIRGGSTGFLHRPVDRVAPDFTLTDQNGERVSLADFRGKWVVVDWIYTNCKTVCPAFTAELSIVRNGLGERVGQEVQLVSITFDPERDTPEAMKAQAAKVNGDIPGWSWLTGAKSETDAVAEAYGLAFEASSPAEGAGHSHEEGAEPHQDTMFDHTALLVVIGPDGRERDRYFGTGWSQDLLERLEAKLASSDSPILAQPVSYQPSAADLLDQEFCC